MIKTFRAKGYIADNENINIITVNDTSQNEVPHVHEFAEFVYVCEGSAVHRINGVEYPVKKGSFLFINYNQTHSIEVRGDKWSYVNILLKPEFFHQELINSENVYEIFSFLLAEEFTNHFEGLSPVVVFRGKERTEVEELIVRMQREFAEKRFGYQLVLKGCLDVLFAHMFRGMRGVDNVSSSCMNTIMPDVIAYINEHCMDKITLQEIAASCFYDKAYLSRTFKKHFGISPMEYIQDRRLTEAANLLTTTEDTIENICNKVGCSDRKQFYRLFEKKFGMTPGTYRKLK